MKPRFLLCLVLLAIVGMPAASSRLSAKDTSETEASKNDGKKNTTVVTLTAKPDAVHTAALEALAAVGGTVTKDTADYIEAKRSHKVGLAVGSGGEKLFVWIRDLGEGKVEVKVTTKKTLLGIVGQKLWNDEIAEHIAGALK